MMDMGMMLNVASMLSVWISINNFFGFFFVYSASTYEFV